MVWQASVILGAVLAVFVAAPAEASVVGWRSAAPMPGVRVRAAAVAGAGGNVFVLGGRSGGHPASALMLNPRTGQWQVRHPMPVRLQDLGAVRFHRQILAIGGFTYAPQGVSANVFAYKPRTDTWRYWKPLPAARAYVGAVTSHGKIFVLGGVDNQWELTTDVYCYDPHSGNWATVSQMPNAREGFQVTKDRNGLIYVIGGWETTPTGWARSTTIEVYDPVADTWTSRPAMPQSLDHGGTVSHGPDGRIYVVGGMGPADPYGSSYAVRKVVIYNPATDTWSPGPALVHRRSGASLTVAGDRLWAFGGIDGDYDGRVILDSVESLRP